MDTQGPAAEDGTPPDGTPPDVAVLLQEVSTLLAAALGPTLTALYVHGSLVAGDFAPARSDVDLLAVLAREPDDDLLRRLEGVHAEVDRAFPAWQGRVEVEDVALNTLQGYAAPGSPAPATIARVSPGERLHLLPATTHRVLTWSSVHEGGRALVGAPAREVVPRYDEGSTRAALLDHVRDWPAWVQEMTTPGAQAYAVLTLCRAAVRLETGRQVSKKAAAGLVAAAEPGRADLALWARDWWYGGGRDEDPPRPVEVGRFVEQTSARLLARQANQAGSTGQGCGTGSLSVLLAGHGHRVTGVDLSDAMVARAAAKGRAGGVDAVFRQGDVSRPDLALASTDVVLSRHVLWAMPDPGDVLARWVRLLRPGGRLVLVE